MVSKNQSTMISYAILKSSPIYKRAFSSPSRTPYAAAVVQCSQQKVYGKFAATCKRREKDCSGVARKAGFSQRLASGGLTSCERGSRCGMAQTITAEPRQPQ